MIQMMDIKVLFCPPFPTFLGKDDNVSIGVLAGPLGEKASPVQKAREGQVISEYFILHRSGELGLSEQTRSGFLGAEMEMNHVCGGETLSQVAAALCRKITHWDLVPPLI